MYPKDVDPESGCRLPLPRREQLDDPGRRTYDSLADPNGGTIRGRGALAVSYSTVPNSLDTPGRSTAICDTRQDSEDAFVNWPSSPLPVNSTISLNGQHTSRRRSARAFRRISSKSSSTARTRAAWTRPTRSSSSSAVRSSARGRWCRRPSLGPYGSSASVLWSISSPSWAIMPGQRHSSAPSTCSSIQISRHCYRHHEDARDQRSTPKPSIKATEQRSPYPESPASGPLRCPPSCASLGG